MPFWPPFAAQAAASAPDSLRSPKARARSPLSQPPPPAYKLAPGAKARRVTLPQRVGNAAKMAAASVVLAFAAAGVAHAGTATRPDSAQAPTVSATAAAPTAPGAREGAAVYSRACADA
jgi:hypothetical protein